MKRNGKRALAIVMSLCMVMTPLETVTSAEEMTGVVMQSETDAAQINAAVDNAQEIPAEIAAEQGGDAGNLVDPAADGNRLL